MNNISGNFIKQQKDMLPPEQLKLLERAVNVLESNTYDEGTYPWSPYVCISPCKGRFNGIWNWDSAFHAMAVSRWNPSLAWDCIMGFTKYQLDNGMFPDVIFENGDVVDKFSKPPVLPWVTAIVYSRDRNLDNLRELYTRFVKNEHFLRSSRICDGLFYYGAQDKTDDKYEKRASFESGWDDSVRWDKTASGWWPIDLNCYMVMFYRSMAFMARELELIDEAYNWERREIEMRVLINERLWDPDNKYYADTDRFTGKQSDVLTPASFMPLFAEIAPPTYALAMNKLAIDKSKFDSRMPTVTFDNPQFSQTYWRGPTWLNTAFFAAKGLKNYDFPVAYKIRDTILNWCIKEQNGIFENYDSITGKGLYCNNFSWSAAFIIEFLLNF